MTARASGSGLSVQWPGTAPGVIAAGACWMMRRAELYRRRARRWLGLPRRVRKEHS